MRTGVIERERERMRIGLLRRGVNMPLGSMGERDLDLDIVLLRRLCCGDANLRCTGECE